MAFLFKSKKNQQDRALQSRDGPPVSGGISAAARVGREEKSSRSTPTGSLNSLDESGSPNQDLEKYAVRRAPEPAQQPPLQSDLPVSPVGEQSRFKWQSLISWFVLSSCAMRLLNKTQMRHFSRGRNADSTSHPRCPARSLDMELRSIVYHRKRATYMSWVG